MKHFALALALALAVGCHAQIPPATNHTVTLNWTAPASTANWAGCTTSAPCTYGVYRCTVSQTACSDTSNTGWSELTSAGTRVSALTYVDATVTGGSAWYAVKTFQGSNSSGPSNIALAVVPASPIAPAINTTVARNDKPLISVPEASGTEMASITNLRVR